MALNIWKANMISDPYKYLLFIVGLYQRSVLLFFYGSQCCCYLKYLPISSIVSCCIFVVSMCSIDNKHYRFKKIFMAHGDYNTEVELESLRETGVGGLQ